MVRELRCLAERLQPSRTLAVRSRHAGHAACATSIAAAVSCSSMSGTVANHLPVAGSGRVKETKTVHCEHNPMLQQSTHSQRTSDIECLATESRHPLAIDKSAVVQGGFPMKGSSGNRCLPTAPRHWCRCSYPSAGFVENSRQHDGSVGTVGCVFGICAASAYVKRSCDEDVTKGAVCSCGCECCCGHYTSTAPTSSSPR